MPVGDSGPIYWETRLSNPLGMAEPLNALSNLGFLLIIIYWSFWLLQGPSLRRRLKGGRWDWPSNKAFFSHEIGFDSYLMLGLPILFMGWLGGTIYHGWRAGEIWYLLDYLPIPFLVAWTSFFLFSKSEAYRRRTPLAFTLSLAAPLLSTGVLAVPGFSNQIGSITYLLLFGTMVISILPLRKKLDSFSLAIAAAVLVSGILLRSFEMELVALAVDTPLFPWLARGTHWLWHVMGALALHLFLLVLAQLKVSDQRNS